MTSSDSQREFFFHDPIESVPALARNADQMRVISLHQPWSTLVAIGAKKFETRSWGTPYRGPLAIHASKKWEEDEMELVMQSPFCDVLTAAGYSKPRELVELGGHVVAITMLVDVRLMTPAMIDAVKGTNEYEFGAWAEGRYAWKLSNVKKLDTPIPLRGQQGLWPWAEGARLFGAHNSA